MEGDQYDLLELLEYIERAELDYQDWVNVGMALQQGGYHVSVWDDWSRRDPARYHAGECERKWESFRGTAKPVTGGTIVQLAREHGWVPSRDPGRALDWGDVIPREGIVVDKNWVEEKELEQPKNWDPVRDLIRYLETLFDSTENVGYVTTCFEKDGKYMPTKGNSDRTAGQLIEQLSRCYGDVGSGLGDYNPKVGAWIRFNPLDGNGCKNDNVTDFRYALVESDSMAIERQNVLIWEPDLSVACPVYFG